MTLLSLHHRQMKPWMMMRPKPLTYMSSIADTWSHRAEYCHSQAKASAASNGLHEDGVDEV